MNILVALIPLLPLITFIIIGLNFRRLPKMLTSMLGCGSVLVSFILSVIVFLQVKSAGTAIEVKLFDWILTAKFNVSFALVVDPLSALMLLVVTGVGFLIHVYSIGYMGHDEGYNRFFAYMNLFVFSMLILVLGSNFLMMFIGWEGVGLCSYLLIGFWYKNNEYNNAAKKAFIMNRIGDLGFLLGIFLIYVTFGSLNYKDVFTDVASFSGANTITAITLLLFVGAIGKSAQIPLMTWLPDAMAGPTPVSALIHAATMVTAGVYMVARSQALYVLAPLTLNVIAILGAITALVAASIAIYQNDIKKVLAYSTVSQLGYMFIGLGVGAFTGSMFHLTTHAFFKALLFLGAGSVIHALGGEQDIRKMGGLRKALPVTYWVFLIATIAISGIPPFAGFFSKDEILAFAFERNKAIWVLGVIGSLMTAFYMFRLFFLTFNNEFRGTGEQKHHLHESPYVMTIPLMVLAVLSVIGGFMGVPEALGGHHALNKFLESVFPVYLREIHMEHGLELSLMAVAVVGALLMIVWAWFKFGKRNVVPAADGVPQPLPAKVLAHKYYLDEIYETLFVKPLDWLSGVLHKIVDVKIIDGLVNGIGNLVVWSGGKLRFLQAGKIGFYLTVMVFAIVAMLFWLLF